MNASISETSKSSETKSPYGEIHLTENSVGKLEVDTNDSNTFTQFDLTSPVPLLDQIINQLGCSQFHFKNFLLTGLINFIEGIEVSLSGLIFLPIMKNYSLNKWEGCMISSILFIAMAFGSLFSGWFAAKGRKLCIMTSLALIFFGTCASSIPNATVLCISRCIIGMALGPIIPMINNHFCEILPSTCRSFWIIFVSAFFSVGAIVTCFVMSATNRSSYHDPNISLFFILIAIPILLIFFVFFFFYEENPRYLILTRQDNEGFARLEQCLHKKIDETSRGLIVKQLVSGGNKNSELRFSMIFGSKYFRTTLILTFIWIFYSMLVNGGVFSIFVGLLYSTSMLPEVFNEKFHIHVIEVSLFYCFFIVSTIISGCLTEIKCCGRKNTISFGFLVSVAVCLCALLLSSTEFILFALGALFINISFNAINSYSIEVYPTRIRDLALGFLLFISRIAGFLSNLSAVFFGLYESNWHFYLNLFIGIAGFVLTLLLPFDTYRRPLDKEVQPVSGVTIDGIENKIITEDDIINKN